MEWTRKKLRTKKREEEENKETVTDQKHEKNGII